MIDFNGFDKGVIGKKLPSDSTLYNMRKADLIELLHIAEHNHTVLAEVYQIAVDTNKCNRCPLPKMNEEHDKHIRADVIDECIDILNNSIPLVNNTDIVFGFKCAVERLEQLKEKKDEL